MHGRLLRDHSFEKQSHTPRDCSERWALWCPSMGHKAKACDLPCGRDQLSH